LAPSLSAASLLSNTPEQGTVEELTEVLFVDLAVLLEEKVCGAPFEHVCEPTIRIDSTPMTVGHAEQFLQLEGAVIVFVPLGKEILEELRNESPFRVIDTTVGPMLGFVYTVDIDSEKGVREPRMGETRGVREVEVDDEDCKNREQDIEAKLAEADVCIVRPDHSVAVSVPKEDVLLKYRVVFVFLGVPPC